MKTLTIGDTTYNLAYLISVKYKARTRKDAPKPKSKKKQPPFSPPPVRPTALSTAFTPKANS